MIYPSIDPIIFQLGPIAVRWYGLMYIAGIGLGYWLVKNKLAQLIPDKEKQLNLITAITAGVMIGGRIGYILIYDLSYYVKNPLKFMAIWQGGMSFHGGAIGAAAACLILAKRYQVNTLSLLDLLGLGATVGIGLGRIGNLINGELVGRVTTVSWGMAVPGYGPFLRHPSPLYEAIGEGLILGLTLYIVSRYISLKPGHLFSIFLGGYGLIRFGLEYFREPDTQVGYIFTSFTMGQVLCMLMMVLSILTAYIIQTMGQKK